MFNKIKNTFVNPSENTKKIVDRLVDHSHDFAMISLGWMLGIAFCVIVDEIRK